MIFYNQQKIGRMCREFRENYLGISRSEAARQIGFTAENVRKFETGENDNYTILLWYIAHGLNVDEVMTNGKNK